MKIGRSSRTLDLQAAGRCAVVFDKHSQFIGGAGGAGEGYCAPASAGAALANKKHGRLSVSINGDGDMMYARESCGPWPITIFHF